MWAFIGGITFFAGFAVCWFAKDKIQGLVIGGKALASKLEAKAAKIKAAL